MNCEKHNINVAGMSVCPDCDEERREAVDVENMKRLATITNGVCALGGIADQLKTLSEQIERMTGAPDPLLVALDAARCEVFAAFRYAKTWQSLTKTGAR